jgi:hypothetical protein
MWTWIPNFGGTIDFFHGARFAGTRHNYSAEDAETFCNHLNERQTFK